MKIKAGAGGFETHTPLRVHAICPGCLGRREEGSYIVGFWQDGPVTSSLHRHSEWTVLIIMHFTDEETELRVRSCLFKVTPAVGTRTLAWNVKVFNGWMSSHCSLSLTPTMASFLLTLCWTWSPPQSLVGSPLGLLLMMDRHPSIQDLSVPSCLAVAPGLTRVLWHCSPQVTGASPSTEIVGVLPDPCLVMGQEGQCFRMLPVHTASGILQIFQSL